MRGAVLGLAWTKEIVSAEIAVVLGLVVYKLACLAVGTLFAWLGYRLFMAGIWGAAGNLEANFKDWRLMLKSAAPGTFFVVLGAVVILYAVFTGLKLGATKNIGAVESVVPFDKAPSLPKQGNGQEAAPAKPARQ